MFRTISTLLLSVLFAIPAGARDIPEVVRDYARSFARFAPVEEDAPSTSAMHEEYAKYFFQGFMLHGGSPSAQSALANHAYARGAAYWRDHPSERSAILLAFGYVAIERDGYWSRGFERSAFIPDAPDDDGERMGWWMHTYDDASWKQVGLDAETVGTGRARIRIVGYLSPEGRYGHLGAWKREVLVTSGGRLEPESR